MLKFLFRKDWESPFRSFHLIYFGVTILLVLAIVVSLFEAPYNSLGWYITSTTEILKIPLLAFSLGLFKIELFGDNFLVNQYFSGSPHQVSAWLPYAHLCVVVLCLVMLLAIVSFLRTFWFTIAMGLLVVFLMALQLNQLMLFGIIGNAPVIGIAVLYIGISYYFQAFGTSIGLLSRWLVFFGTTLLLAILISFGSAAEQPFMLLATTGIFGAIILSIFFIILIGHELVYLILYLITATSQQYSKRNAMHFTVFTLIYLLNIGLAYAKAARHIDWDILYINAFVLLIVSTLVGFWSFSQREKTYQHIFPFYPFGGLLYVSLAALTLSTVWYQMAAGNDPLLETLEDAILFSHLGFGSMFFIYIIANFITPLIKNMMVYKIAFNEANFPYVTANLAGLIVVLALYFLGDQASLNQAIAGMYNLSADAALSTNQPLAKHLYYQGSVYGYSNHRSNYMLGLLSTQDKELGKSITHYKAAIAKNATPHAYINLSNVYRENNNYFDALFLLQEGVEKFPKDGALKNNLALLFGKTNIVDSTLYYLQSIEDRPATRSAAAVNLMSFYAKKGIKLPLDSLQNTYAENKNIPLQANLKAFLNQQKIQGSIDFDPGMIQDSSLNAFTFPYLQNNFVSFEQYPENLRLLPIAYGKFPGNGDYTAFLGFATSWQNYATDKVTQAFGKLTEVAHLPTTQQGQYYHSMGVFALHQRDYRAAITYFNQAAKYRFPDPAKLALAHLEIGKVSEALPYIAEIVEDEMRKPLLAAALMSYDEMLDANDQIRYLCLRYRYRQFSDEQISRLAGSFTETIFRERAILMLIRKLLDQGNYSSADNFLGLIPFGTTPETENERLLLHDYLRIGMGLPAELSPEDLFVMEIDDPNTKKLYKALQFSVSSPQQAEPLFHSLAYDNPYFVEGVLSAVDFFQAKDDQDEVYNILQKAIDLNAYSVPLIKAYIEQALSLNFTQYAEAALIRLIDLMPEEEFKKYEALYDARVRDYEKRRAEWTF